MRVLYVNHTASVSGAEQSLLVLLRALGGTVQAAVACPAGPLEHAVRRLDVPVHTIPGTDLSARLHPVHTPRALGDVLDAAVAIRSLARRLRVDVVHANTERAALMSCFARGCTGAPPLVHVRDSIPPGRLPAAMFGYLARRASAFLPTAQFLAAQLPRTRGGAPLVKIVPNAVEPRLFDPARTDRTAARARLGIGAEDPVLAVVGQISPHKGQRDAIEILDRVRASHPTARLLVVGSVKFASPATRFDNRRYAAEIAELTRRLKLEDSVHFLGERADVADVLSAVDLLLVPSWYEPFGRSALEGMMMELPVLVTSVGGAREIVRDGIDGLLLQPRQVETWARAACELLDDPSRRRQMGVNGRRRGLTEFGPDTHVRAIVGAYEEVLNKGWRGSATPREPEVSPCQL